MIRIIGYLMIVVGLFDIFLSKNSTTGWLWVILGNIHLLQAQHADTIRINISDIKQQMEKPRDNT